MIHLLRVRLPRALAICLGVVAVLALPSTASADIPILKFKAGPVAPFNNVNGMPVSLSIPGDPSTNDLACMHVNPSGPVLDTNVAGKTTDYCISFAANPGDAISGEDINNTLVQLPVGTQADIDLASKCTVDQFSREAITPNTCPASSQVGTALATLQAPAAPDPAVDRQTLNSPGRIFALTTPDGKAALLGVALLASTSPTVTETKFLIEVSQLGDPKIGLQNQTDHLSKTVGASTPIAIQATSLRFWGSAAAHTHSPSPFNAALPAVGMSADFFRVGSTCATDQTATLTINPYTDTPATAGSKPTTATTTYKLTGCDSLKFEPTFTAAISGETQPGGHPQLDVKITSPAGDEDLGGTRITMPAGIATDLTRIQNACPQATFQAGTCPETAVIGSVKAELSGISSGVLAGDVLMVKVEGKQLPALGLNFKGRLPLRVFGTTDVDGQGRLVSTFSDLPSLPQRSLDITLVGGARGILQTDPTGKCTASAYEATLSGQNGKTKSFSLPTVCDNQFTATLSNSSKERPVLLLTGAAATGKKIKTLRVGLPKGLRFDAKNLRNEARVIYADNGFDQGVDGKATKAAKVGARARFTIAGNGSNLYSILTRTGVLRATKAFTESTATVYVEYRIVFYDGTKVTKYVALKRAG